MNYKILGLSLVAFVFVMLFVLLSPDEGLDKRLFDNKNIDSFIVKKPTKDYKITASNAIDSISKFLKNAQKVTPDRIKINKGLYKINFYIKDQKKAEQVIILYSYYSGTLIIARNVYYDGSSLDKFLSSLKAT